MLRLNLLPPALRPKMVINLDRIFFFYAIIIGLVVGVSFLRVQALAQKVGNEHTALEATSTDQKKLIEELRAKEAKKDTSNVESLIANRKKWNPIMKELTYILPYDVWLTKMVIRSDKNIVDMQLSGRAPSQRAVNRFLGRLERSVSFQNVKLNTSEVTENFTPVLYGYDFSVPDVFSSAPRAPASEAPKP